MITATLLIYISTPFRHYILRLIYATGNFF